MSFFYTNSAATARTRRSKDKETHGQNRTTTSTTARRPKESSKSREDSSPPPKTSPRNSIHVQPDVTPEQLLQDPPSTMPARKKESSSRPRPERSPPPAKPPATTSRDSLYGLQNTAMEHLPSSTPISEPASKPTSNVLPPATKTNQASHRSSGVYHLPYQPHTPAALQKYLEEENEEGGKDQAEDEGSAHDGSSTADSMHLPPSGSSPEFQMPGQFPSPSQVEGSRAAEHQSISASVPELSSLQEQQKSISLPKSHSQGEAEGQTINKKVASTPNIKELGHADTNTQIAKDSINSDLQQPKVQSMMERHDSSPLLPYMVRAKRHRNSSPPVPNHRGSREQRHSIQLPPEGRPEVEKLVKQLERKPSQDSKSVQSEPISSSHDNTPLPRDVQSQYFQTESPQALSRSTSHVGGDTVSVTTSSPPPLSRSSSLARQPLPVHERSFTPPPPPGTAVGISNTPPPYMSPVPVRAHLPGRQFVSYSGTQGFPMYSPNMQHTEMGPMSQPHAPYYMDYPSTTSHHGHQPVSYNPVQGHAAPNQGQVPSQYAQHNRALPTDYENDPSLLLHRVKAVLPDFQRLLEKYHEASGQLGDKPDTNRQIEGDAAETIREKDARIEALQKDLEMMQNKHNSEYGELREHVLVLENKNKDLDNAVISRMKSRDELRETVASLRNENSELNRQIKEEEAVYKVWREQEVREWTAKERSLREQLEAKATTEGQLRQQLNKVTAPVGIDKQAVDNMLASQKKELEAIHNRSKHDLEKVINELRQELEKARRSEASSLEQMKVEVGAAVMREAQARESWKREREELNKSWSEERQRLEKQRTELLTLSEHYQTEKKELQASLETEKSKAAKAESLQTENAALQKEIEKINANWNTDKEKYSRGKENLRSAALKLATENQNLQKMIEAFGEATELKSRGDAYFIKAFEQLHAQIRQLATTYCKETLEADLPDHVTQSIPSALCSILSDRTHSVELRKCYLQSTTSRILDRRIFQPFLFTLSRHHDTANDLFEGLSAILRQKFPKREAIWRQQTLYAAYTAPHAKQQVNRVAAHIVDEIMHEIEHFTWAEERSQVLDAVRGVVKLAAETWRYARLEADTIRSAFDCEGRNALFEPIDAPNSETFPESDAVLRVLPCFYKEQTLIATQYFSSDPPSPTAEHESESSQILCSGKALYHNRNALKSLSDTSEAFDDQEVVCINSGNLAIRAFDTNKEDENGQISEDENIPLKDSGFLDASLSPLVKSMDLSWQLDTLPLKTPGQRLNSVSPEDEAATEPTHAKVEEEGAEGSEDDSSISSQSLTSLKSDDDDSDNQSGRDGSNVRTPDDERIQSSPPKPKTGSPNALRSQKEAWGSNTAADDGIGPAIVAATVTAYDADRKRWGGEKGPERRKSNKKRRKEERERRREIKIEERERWWFLDEKE